MGLVRDDDEGGKDSEEARWRAQDEDAYFARATYANCRFGVVQGGPTPKRARRGDDDEEEDDATAQRVYERMGRDAAFADAQVAAAAARLTADEDPSVPLPEPDATVYARLGKVMSPTRTARNTHPCFPDVHVR